LKGLSPVAYRLRNTA